MAQSTAERARLQKKLDAQRANPNYRSGSGDRDRDSTINLNSRRNQSKDKKERADPNTIYLNPTRKQKQELDSQKIYLNTPGKTTYSGQSRAVEEDKRVEKAAKYREEEQAKGIGQKAFELITGTGKSENAPDLVTGTLPIGFSGTSALGVGKGAAETLGGHTLKAGKVLDKVQKLAKSKLVKGTIGGVISFDALTNWLGNDNYITNIGLGNKMAVDVYNAQPTPENKAEAESAISSSIERVDGFITKVSTSIKYNPLILLSGRGKEWLINAEVAKENMERQLKYISESDDVAMRQELEYWEQVRSNKLGNNQEAERGEDDND